MTEIRHFLDLDRVDAESLRAILDASHAGKTGNEDAPPSKRPLDGKVIVCIFEKPSTRTRLSIEIAIRKLGGEAVMLNPADSQLKRGETLADLGRLLSRYADAVFMRTYDAARQEELAKHATIPVINGLTDKGHPCQLMADVMTLEQHKGDLKTRKIAWSGAWNNMTISWVHAAARFGFELSLACPDETPPDDEILAWAKEQGATITLTRDPVEAVAGADCVVTDVWVSMNEEGGPDSKETEPKSPHNIFAPYQVNERLMAAAKADAVFMHCLPAHRGEEVSAAVIDGPQSIVWDEAENRIHAQKGVLLWCLNAI